MSCPTGLSSIPESFWRRLRQAGDSLLLLDYDGTLAPFRRQRNQAVPYSGIGARIDRLVQLARTRVVIVSGRPAGEVAALLGVDPAPEIWGVHGFERRYPDGRLERRELPPDVEAALQRAARCGEELLPLEQVERKAGAVALHWRGLPEPEIGRLRAALSERLGGLGLALHPFDGGLEVRALGVDKGEVVRRLKAEMPAACPAAYLGDDHTDEDAFAALDESGLALLVRSVPRPTRAQVRLVPPDDVLGLLDRWIRACEVGGGG